MTIYLWNERGGQHNDAKHSELHATDVVDGIVNISAVVFASSTLVDAVNIVTKDG